MTAKKLALALSVMFAATACQADQQSDKSEFRIYYYETSGLVYDEGHGAEEYNAAIRYMHMHSSAKAGWFRFRALCGKMVAGVTCAKFDEDTSKPGADYFCGHLNDYADTTLKDFGESDLVAVEDLCEAHFAISVRELRTK
ncbi:hypothetical protein CNR33_00076 [Pseudomonas phage tabernarius]|uniref:Lipoprotein n=1 Tax=Pseudomonas phage tabernarius TaxID=2048978 RepID=A0A2H4P6W6_9CAUD|nr:hypothetical protein FDJ17_gp76 [Pseudomonas phage tabernarius]ATW57922.1 hypothetical protein CNR33_00076 [Pseudomonas phage tabernarius]